MGLQIDKLYLAASGRPDEESKRSTQRPEESEVGDGYFHVGTLSAWRVHAIGPFVLPEQDLTAPNAREVARIRVPSGSGHHLAYVRRHVRFVITPTRKLRVGRVDHRMASAAGDEPAVDGKRRDPRDRQ